MCPVNQSPGPGLEAKVIPACHNYNKQTNKQTCEDEKVSIEEELSEKMAEFEDFIQSVDVASMSKI